jgi:5'(3')-deoxyribonucleotidase
MSKIIYVDMDGVLVDFESGIKSLSVEELKLYENKLDEVPGIFSRMIPIEGALESFEKISKQFDVYILSTAPWENPTALNDKLAWIKKYIGETAKKLLKKQGLTTDDQIIKSLINYGSGVNIPFLQKGGSEDSDDAYEIITDGLIDLL